MNLWEYLETRAARRASRPPNMTLVRDVLGAVLVAAFIAVIGGLFWRVIPKENEQLIVYMLGQLSGFVSAVVALHYVTKAGEREQEAARTANTGKALDAITAAQNSPGPGEGPRPGDAAPLREGDTVELNRTGVEEPPK